MSDDAELDSFATELQQQVISRSEIKGMEQLREEPFTEIMIDYLREAGESRMGSIQHRGHGVQVNGYGVSEDEECLDLFVSNYTSAVPPETVLKRDVDALFKRLLGFLTKSLDGYAGDGRSLARVRLGSTNRGIQGISIAGSVVSFHRRIDHDGGDSQCDR